MGIISKLKKLKSDDAIDSKDAKETKDTKDAKDGSGNSPRLFSKLRRNKSDDTVCMFETVNPPDDGPEYARKKYVPPGQVGHGLWIGPLGSCRTDLCAERGITHIVNCSREVRLLGWVDFDHLQRKGIAVEHLNWLDNATQQIFPSPDLNRAVKFIDQALKSGGQVLINCSQGVSRSTTMVCSYLIIRKGYSAAEAIAACKKARPVTEPNPNFTKQLVQLEACVKAKGNKEAAVQELVRSSADSVSSARSENGRRQDKELFA